ncbi:multidrug efflux SMR transporter [Agromyces mediolanus]|uniref:DMT family transporter n=1 Tax=Agromyces mediolanus TaxID=41986 RepID=UPI00383925A9
MAWVILIASGVLEAVWATALGKSEGFTKLWPSVIFFGALALSMGGLAWAMRDISTGTAYAVWVGIGAALTVVWAMVTGDAEVSWIKIALLVGLVGCVVGLKFVDGGSGH